MNKIKDKSLYLSLIILALSATTLCFFRGGQKVSIFWLDFVLGLIFFIFNLALTVLVNLSLFRGGQKKTLKFLAPLALKLTNIFALTYFFVVTLSIQPEALVSGFVFGLLVLILLFWFDVKKAI